MDASMYEKTESSPFIRSDCEHRAFRFVFSHCPGCHPTMCEDYDQTSFNIKGSFDCTAGNRLFNGPQWLHMRHGISRLGIVSLDQLLRVVVPSYTVNILLGFKAYVSHGINSLLIVWADSCLGRKNQSIDAVIDCISDIRNLSSGRSQM